MDLSEPELREKVALEGLQYYVITCVLMMMFVVTALP